MSEELNGIQCRIIDDGRGGAPRPLTVGDIFRIDCVMKQMVLKPSKLKFETQKPFQLHLLKSDLAPDGRLQLTATSYQVGEYRGEDLKLTDGLLHLPVQGVQFNVESVIDPKNPPKGPYGPLGGHILFPPVIYFWGSIVVALVGMSMVGIGWFRRWQKKRLIEGLKKHDSRLSPQAQLHSRFRALERQRFLEGEELKKSLPEIEDILRLYVIRQFTIPAYDWSDRLVLKEFQQRYRFLGMDVAKELGVLLRETRKVKVLENPEAKDIEQLVKKIKRWADRADRSMGPQNSRNSPRTQGVNL